MLFLLPHFDGTLFALEAKLTGSEKRHIIEGNA